MLNVSLASVDEVDDISEERAGEVREEDEGVGVVATGEEAFEDLTVSIQDKLVGLNSNVIIANQSDIFRCVRIEKFLEELLKNLAIVSLNSEGFHPNQSKYEKSKKLDIINKKIPKAKTWEYIKTKEQVLKNPHHDKFILFIYLI